MTKKIALVLAVVLIVTVCFTACKKDDTNTDTDATNQTNEGLENAANEFDLVEDEDGNLVAVIIDEKGDAYAVDENGKKTKKKVKVKETTAKSSENSNNSNSDVKKPAKPNVDNKTDNAEGTTNDRLTTLKYGKDKVPTTNDSGTPVKFSDEDISTVTYILEVPYLYAASYENSQGVPIEIANHAACWMAQKNGANSTSFASGEVVLNLFKYFAQTVQNYSENCNYDRSENKAPITYNSSNGTFSIVANEGDSIEKKTHSVSIDSIEYLGNNNYYKVNATISEKNSSGCKYKKLTAVIQKNMLDADLGFSVKALKWS